MFCGAAGLRPGTGGVSAGHGGRDGTRSERAPLDTPANVTIITAKEIRDKGYQSAFEAVQELSQANVHTYQQDGGDYGSMMSRIRLRGIDDATLVLINGNPANSI